MNERISRLALAPHLREILSHGQGELQEDIPRCVLDTNVLLDLLIWKDPRAKALALTLSEKRLYAIYSAATLEEFADVIARETFRLELKAQEALLDAALAYGALWSHPIPASGVRCKDNDDTKFLDLAVASSAAFLLSKDKRVLRCAKRLKAKSGTRILTPEAYATLAD